MHLRKLHLPKLLIAIVVGASWANVAFALGLGEITLNSALDQPLDAEIRLLQVRDLSAEEILVKLASQEQFDNAGVDRPFFLQDLKFEVELNTSRGPVVHVTTTQPVREPFLIFLIEMKWPGSGSGIVREYTLLMDLPVFTDQTPAPVQPTQTQPQTTQQAPQPTTVPRQQTTPTRPVTPAPQVAQPRPPQPTSQQRNVVTTTTRAGVDVYGPIQANDTLWEIALKVRPNRNVSVQQTMLALQRLNPDAFIDNNINLIKRGQVLRIPDRDEILQLSQRDAVREVAVQNDQWASNRRVSGTGAELVGTRTRPTTTRDNQGVRGQVTLTAPGDTQGAGSRSGGSGDKAELEALQNELAINLEELDKSHRENDELRSRVSELQDQIATMERLIDLNNEEMKKLQTALEQGDQAAATDTAAATTTEPVTTEPQPSEVGNEQAPSTTPENVQASTAPATTPSAETPAPAVKQPAPVQPRPQPEPSIIDLLMEYIYYVIAGVVVILAGVLFALHRRSQAQMEAFDELEDEEFYHEDVAEEEPEQEEEFALTDDEFDIGAEPESQFEEEEPATPTESETGDAVAEADIYIAYGKYDQAAEMLQKAIIGDPQNLEARLKLLEVYAESKDVEKFDMEYGQLLALGDTDAIARAAELRQTIPGAGQYQGEGDTGGGIDFGAVDDLASATGSEAGEESFSTDLGDLDLDLDAEEDTGVAAAPATDDIASEESAFNDDGSIDFQLDLDEDEGTAPEADTELDLSAELAEEGGADGGLDFSLDLDDDTGLADAAATDDGDLNLGLGVGDDFTAKGEDLGEELSLDLEDDGDISLEDFGQEEAEAGVPEAAAEDDDILSDLEFSAGALDEEAEAEEPAAETADDLRLDTGFYQELEGGDEELLTADSGATEESDLGDDFDMEMGDIDLAALDQEMDALVGGLDDIDEEEDTVAAPTEVMPSIKDEDLSLGSDATEVVSAVNDELDEDLADLDDLDVGVTTEDTADEFGDDLTFGMGSPAGAADEGGGIGEDMNAELDFLADTDEVATKLDLARAYIDMGDMEGAKDILDEVSAEGNQDQQQEAKELLTKIG